MNAKLKEIKDVRKLLLRKIFVIFTLIRKNILKDVYVTKNLNAF